MSETTSGQPHGRAVRRRGAPRTISIGRRVWTIAALLALVVVLAVAARRGPLPGDEQLLRAWSSPNQAVALINVLASVQVWSVLVILTGACLWVIGRRYAAVLVVLADLSGEVVAFLVKAIVLRPRPSDAPLADALATASFPSGHVMRVAVSLGIIIALCAWQHPRWRWPCTALAVGLVLVVGIARIASGEHWPSDVVAGAVLAAAWVEVVLAIGSWLNGRRMRRPSRVS